MQGTIYPSLKDRAVLVTGGGSGIGEAIVRNFVGQGARVGFIDIDLEASQQLLASLPAEAKVHFAHADLRDIGALRAAVAGARAALGPITILVNNAARDDRHAIEDVTPDYWDERIAVNLKHQFFAAQAVAPDMIQAGGGAIVNLGSVSWVLGQGNMPCYTTAKSAIQGLTRALARDLGPSNVRVNSILPGWIMTERAAETLADARGRGRAHAPPMPQAQARAGRHRPRGAVLRRRRQRRLHQPELHRRRRLGLRLDHHHEATRCGPVLPRATISKPRSIRRVLGRLPVAIT